jgi:pyruvate/2-oxoglutarate dehydrogenase complex dihydrolipoamide dehydrogenase (E3) component
VTRRFRKPARCDYNLVVIGAGSAGLVAAYLAAALKAKVALIEKHRMGGDCLNTGCVPSKALIRSAAVLRLIERARDFGLRAASAEFDFGDVMQRVHDVIRRIEPHDSIERYRALGVECITGEAYIASPYEVRVGARTLTTRNIIVATGARPRIPEIPGIERVHVRTSDDIWELREQPRRLLVLGGGPIGCELAQAFRRLGSEVTLVQRNAQLLPAEDADAAELLTRSLTGEGVRVLAGCRAERFATDGGHHLICTAADGKEIRVDFDVALLALGRQARVEGFGLEPLGVRLRANGTLETDAYQRTSVPNIYACGDVAGPYQLTHAASHQAWYCAVNALFAPWRRFRVDDRVMPWCTFTDPEVARVGLNENEARERGVAYEVTRYGIDDLDRAIADGEAHGFVKVLTASGTDRILGVTLVGRHAGDLIAEFVLAMKHGLGVNKILGTVHIYPTLAEANKYAAGQWRRAHAPQRVLRWLERLHGWRRGG